MSAPGPPRRRGVYGPPDGEPEVALIDEQAEHPVDERRLMGLAEHVLRAEGVRGACELTLLFVGERLMADLNQRFLGRSGPTDVLAFPLDDEVEPLGRRLDDVAPRPDPPPQSQADIPVLLGDVIICPSVAAHNAPDHAGTYDDELDLLVVHGILHVLGMDHAEPEEAAAMQARERELLAGYAGAR